MIAKKTVMHCTELVIGKEKNVPDNTQFKLKKSLETQYE